MTDQVRIFACHNSGTRQPCYRDMRKIVTWSDHQNHNYRKYYFHKILIMSSWTLCGYIWRSIKGTFQFSIIFSTYSTASWNRLRGGQNPHILHALHWRHNEHDGVSNHRRLDCLLKHLFRRRSRKTLKFRFTDLCEGNPPVTGGFPSHRDTNAENVSNWWGHHELILLLMTWPHKVPGIQEPWYCRNSPWVFWSNYYRG